jgi:hypothetical protein
MPDFTGCRLQDLNLRRGLIGVNIHGRSGSVMCVAAPLRRQGSPHRVAVVVIVFVGDLLSLRLEHSRGGLRLDRPVDLDGCVWGDLALAMCRRGASCWQAKSHQACISGRRSS